MGITGTFKTTRFSDLLRYYATSKDSATIRIQFDPAKPEPDGVFRFVHGELVEASLEGARGREALRRALALTNGSFSEDTGDQEILDSAFMALLEDSATSEPSSRTPGPAAGFVISSGLGAAAANTAASHASGNNGPSPTPAIRSMGGAAAAPAVEPAALAQPPAANSAPPVSVLKPTATSSFTGNVTPLPIPTPVPGYGPAATPPSPAPAPVTGPIFAAPPTPPPVPVAAPTERTTGGLRLGPPPAAVAPADPAPAVEASGSSAQRAPFAESAPSGPRLSPKVLGGIAVAALAAVAVLVVVLTDKSPKAPATGDTAAAPAAPAKAGVPRGVLPDKIVLGMVSSFSGSNRERGRAMKVGWETAIAEVNDAGGINGRKLRLVTQDDGYDPGRTLAGMKNVVEEQSAFAIVGNVGTETAAVAAPYAGQHDAVFFGALSGGDLLRKTPPDHHVFNFRASLAREAESAVRYLVQVRRMNPKHIAVLSQDDSFGASGKRGAMKALDGFGVSAADVLQLTYPRNTADVNDALAQVRAHRKDVDAVVMVATYKPAATFVRKAKDAGLDLFFTTVSADSAGLAEELAESGPDYTRNVLLTQVVPVPTSHATTLVRYRQALEKYAPGEKPSSTSLEAWIGAQIFLEGVRRVGRELDTPKLIAALEGLRDWDIGIGGSITFGPDDHQGCDVVWGWMLQTDGSYKQVDLE